jgi:hypothetical protein
LRSNVDRLSLVSWAIIAFRDLLQVSPDAQYKVSIPEMKEFYRQLKYSHDEIWNKTEANKFFAKEMEYHRKSLNWKDWDKICISWLQQYSNNYWNSWFLPFCWMVALAVFYTIWSNCPDFTCSCWWWIDWTCFWSYLLKNVSQFPTEIKNAPSWWYFFYSIWMWILIYQFIIALRRISQR